MIMTRCIHCTRCVRFLNEVCDSSDLGMLGRGVDSEISSFVFKVLNHELSANIIDLCPVGALTSKPYAFSSRPWELNSIESIDILDSMCSDIRLDYLNNKLMRILPIYNKNFNEDWVTNKIRFVYDSNLYQRLQFPLIRSNGVVNISWVNAFFIFFSKFNEFLLDNKNIIAFFGNLADIETIINLNYFFSSIGGTVYLSEEFYLQQFDIINDYFSDVFLNIENLKNVVFISLNLRLEMPLLNSKFFRLKNSLNLYSVGCNGHVLNYNIKMIGNNSFDLIDLVFGKNFLNKSLFYRSFYKNSFSFSAKAAIKVFFLFGQSFYKNPKAFLLFNYFKYNITNILNARCLNTFSSVGLLNSLIYGSNKLNRYNKSINNTFVFLDSVDNFEFLSKININKSNFIIYKGSFFDNGASMADLILPAKSVFEDNIRFLNYNGNIKMAHKIIFAENNILSSFDFFNCLNFFKNNFFKNGYFCHYVPLKKLIKYFDFLVVNFKFDNYNLHYDFLIRNENYYYFFVDNFLFQNLIINYYKHDVYSRNSKNLSLASFEYLQTLSMYK